MNFTYDAACSCHTGLVRKNNEDNFLFFDKHLPAEHMGTGGILSSKGTVHNGTFLAVFDGVGGEAFGEVASFTAAETLCNPKIRAPLDDEERYLYDVCQNINEAVSHKSKELCVDLICSTMVSMYFGESQLWVFNIGDSRAYLLREGSLKRISMDHTDEKFLLRRGITNRKPKLIQYLGADSTSMRVEPYMLAYYVKQGDIVLLCSDGLTDMLSDDEICRILTEGSSSENRVRMLIDNALEQGGKDNITAIVCEFRV